MPIARRFPSNIVSSRQVVTEISNLVPGSNVQQSGRSSAATFTSKRPIRKRVTSDNRKAMLESFVNKYRAMNLGKFPSPTNAQKEVGGSYYLIRKMLQEMEYNSRISSVEKQPVKGNRKQTKGEDTISREVAIESFGSKDVSTNQITMDQQHKDPWPESVSNSATNFELKEGLQPSTSSANTENSNITRDDTRNIATDSHDIRGLCHEKPEHNAKGESPLEDNSGFDDSEPIVEQQQDGIKNIMRDMAESRKDDELKEKLSIWGNLKSLAAGFINIWKKQ